MKKRSVKLHGHATSISLEPEFWAALDRIAVCEKTSLQKLIEDVDATRETGLASALRVFVLRSLTDT